MSDQSTRQTFIAQLKDFRNDRAWAEFHHVYGDIIFVYARRHGLTLEQAEDIKSQCLLAVVEKMPEFQYDPRKGRFRAWLRQIAYFKIIDRIRNVPEKQAESAQLETVLSDECSPDGLWEQSWRHAHLKYCLSLIKPEVSAIKYQAFEMLVLEEKPVEEVCDALKVNANQVYKAKADIIARLRGYMREFDLE
jgi:RNA polymerase sigma factor (sigma-70 family)